VLAITLMEPHVESLLILPKLAQQLHSGMSDEWWVWNASAYVGVERFTSLSHSNNEIRF
jgi:hypothetical protein